MAGRNLLADTSQNKARNLLAPAAQAEGGAAPPSDLESFGRGALDMFGFGFDDEVGAGLQTGFGFLGDYSKAVEESRRLKRAAQEANPVAYGAGQVAGALPSLIVPGGAAVRGASLGARVAKGALAGAAHGGLYGAGAADEGNRLAGAGVGAGTGLVAGGAIPIAGRVVGNTVGKALSKKVAPTADVLKRRAQALYAAANNAGVVIRNQSMDNLVNRINGKLKVEGFHRRLQPKAAVARQEAEKMRGLTPTLEEVDQLRQIAGAAARGMEPDDRRLAGVIIREIDDWLDNLGPSDVWAGNPRMASGVIKDARRLWSRQKKGRIVEEAVEQAQRAASGFENGLRIEFRKLTSPRAMKKYGWTAAEKKALERVYKGSTASNMLRLLGTFGIPLDQGRNWLGLFGGIAAGSASPAGPLGAVAVPALGTAARAGGNALTRRYADEAGATVRGALPQRQTNAGAGRLADLLTTVALTTGQRGALMPGLAEYMRQRQLIPTGR